MPIASLEERPQPGEHRVRVLEHHRHARAQGPAALLRRHALHHARGEGRYLVVVGEPEVDQDLAVERRRRLGGNEETAQLEVAGVGLQQRAIVVESDQVVVLALLRSLDASGVARAQPIHQLVGRQEARAHAARAEPAQIGSHPDAARHHRLDGVADVAVDDLDADLGAARQRIGGGHEHPGGRDVVDERDARLLVAVHPEPHLGSTRKAPRRSTFPRPPSHSVLHRARRSLHL